MHKCSWCGPGGQPAAAGPARQTAPAGLSAPAGVSSAHKFSWFGPCAKSSGIRGVLVDGVESGGQIRRCLEWEEVPVIILVRRWGERVLPMVEHVASVVGSEVAGLCPEVQENGIGFPAAQGSDGRFVHPRDEESCGSPGAEAVGDDAVGRDVREVLDRGGGSAKG